MTSAQDLTLRVYDSITNPDAWPRILDEIVQLLDAQAANIFVGESLHPELESVWLSDVLSDLFDDESKRDLLASERELYESIPINIPKRGLVSEKELIRRHNAAGFPKLELRDLHNYIKERYNIYHRCTSPLNYKPHYFDFLTVHYGAKYADVPADQTRKATSILPHIAKAIEVNRPFLLLQARFSAILDALDKFKLGVIIVGPDHQLWLKNQAAAAMIECGDSFVISHNNQLVFRKRDDQASVDSMISGMQSGNSTKLRSGKLLLSRQENRQPYLADLSLLNNPDLGTSKFQHGFLLILIDPEQHDLVDFTHFKELYELTPSELDVCKLIVRGHTNREIADIRGVSSETVVSQVKTSFSKTGIQKRTELVRLAHSINLPVHPSGD